jgi:hypothetical protein
MGGGGAVTTTPQDFRVLDVDSSSYPAVESVVVVPRELSGRSLGSDAFQVQANGASRPVEAVRLDADALELAMVVDASVGDDDDFRRAQGAMLEVPVHLPGASVAVVRSSRPATVVWPLTDDPVAASRAVRSMSPGGRPALVDGVASALDAFSTGTSADATELTRRAVVLIAGDAAVDTYQMVAQAMRARDLGITVYVISVGDTVPVDLGRLASMSSGQAVAVSPRNLVSAIDQAIDDLRSQYRLRFDLTEEAQAAGLDGQLPGEVVGAVGLQPAAASVNASGTSAHVPLTIPPGAGTSPDGPTAAPQADSPAPNEDTIWWPTVGMLLLLVVSALGVSRFTSWSAARHAAASGTPRNPPDAEAIEVPEVPEEVVGSDDPPLVPAAVG